MPTITIDNGNHLMVIRCAPEREQDVVVQLLSFLRDWQALELAGANLTITPTTGGGKKK